MYLYPLIHFIYTGYWIMWIVSFSRSDHYEERGVDVKEGGGGGDDEEERQKIKQAQREAVRDFVVRDRDGRREVEGLEG